MKSYAQLAFNSRCKDMTDFIKVVVQKTHKICAKKRTFNFFNPFVTKLSFFSLLFFLVNKVFLYLFSSLF